MAIPLIIGGAALAAGIFGAKKGYDAKKNYAKAKDVVEDAGDKFDKAQKRLERYRNKAAKILQNLGEVRICANADLMKRFIELAEYVDLTEIQHKPIESDVSKININASEIHSMKVNADQASDLLKNGVSALSAGVLTGIGAGGLASTVGVASTGTAISSLGGVAATNATLAWLGGGSIAAGGVGAAGGAAILGGAIAGPVIAVIGFAAAKKSEKALTEAYQHAYEIEGAIEQMNGGVVILKKIINQSDELNQVISALSQRFQIILTQTEEMIFGKKKSKKGFVNFNVFSESEKELYQTMIEIGLALDLLLGVEIFDEEGNIAGDDAAIKNAYKFI